jgi:transcriptional regulator GlxA family with amidase domain
MRLCRISDRPDDDRQGVEGKAMRELGAAVSANIERSSWTSLGIESIRPTGLRPRALRRALAFMEANLGERVTLDALAANAGISRFHFARLFRRSIGSSPMEYLMRARVERGKQFLDMGAASVCEIAARLGFCDQSHFTRTFRRFTGLSPREYVRLQRQTNAFV